MLRFTAVLFLVVGASILSITQGAVYLNQHPVTACQLLWQPSNPTFIFPDQRTHNSSVCAPANSSDLAAVQAIDGIYWVTSLASSFPQSDCQIFEFQLSLNESEYITNVTAYLSGYNSDNNFLNQIRLGIWDYTANNFTTLVNYNSTLFAHLISNFTVTLDGIDLDPSRYIQNDIVTFAACANFDASDSTPILYTWDGSAFTFVDEVGHGFLGSRSTYAEWADGNVGDYSKQLGSYPHTYTAFPSSYLTIDSNNKYSMKLTSEKEEISFVDTTELWVIDHASNVVVYADFLMKPVVHAVTQPETALISAMDQAGNDVTALLASNDHNAWLQDIWVSPGYLDLDFGLESQPTYFKLIVNLRWYKNPAVYSVAPTLGLKTRSRVMIQQWNNTQNAYQYVPTNYNPLHYPGRPSNEGINIHFTRTSLVFDLTGLALDSNNRKIRLVFHDNSRPVQIDSITADFNAPAAYTKNVLSVETATLDHRGRSKGVDLFTVSLLDSLDYYDTEDVSVQPWITGDFTKYGDVTPVLQSVDDEFVIMCRGDRLNLEFDASGLAAPSQSRSFMFYNANYYKAQSRAYGQTVDPLPFANMGTYPYNPSVVSYDTNAHGSYLSTYNTRHYEATTDHHSLNTDYIALDLYTSFNETNFNFVSSASSFNNWATEMF